MSIEYTEMEYNKKKYCPACGNTYTGFPATSRKDNKTLICSDCGTREALIAFFGEDTGNRAFNDFLIERKKRTTL